MRKVSIFLLMLCSTMRLPTVAIGVNSCDGAATPNSGTEPPQPNLSGTWLVDSASACPSYEIVLAKLKVTSQAFSLTGFRGIDRAWTGKFAVGSEGNARNMDLQTDEYNVSQRGSLLVPPLHLRAIYKVEPSPAGDRLVVCYARHSDGPRPTKFAEPSEADDNWMITLRRAGKDFAAFPKEVTVIAIGPQREPVPNAIVFGQMQWHHPAFTEDNGKTWRVDMKSPGRWMYSPVARTGADGSVRIPYKSFAIQFSAPLGIRDEAHHWTGFIAASAARLEHGKLTVQLLPERMVRGTATCAELSALRPTVVLDWQDNQSALFHSDDGSFAFPVPPGTYRLAIASLDTYTSRQFISIPPGVGDFIVPPVPLDAKVTLKGKPAPALDGVIAWKNGPVDLHSLKGKVVLLNFWGYWCGPCVAEMPTLMRLYDKYKQDGLEIVSVHLDAGGEVDTVEKLDRRTAPLRDRYWGGRDLPFSTALASGQWIKHGRTRIGLAYGVRFYPTTVVIGRNGNVLGEAGREVELDLTADDRAVNASIEKLLSAK
jgi:thiol-disulfide isomerase/thioredoxin